MREKRIMIII